ncbi:hypothetical protein DFH11DRAFT_1742409 [Phellopilus nigrolimitatus]|nr:hypothetical protein DFH11DRAFT_1742409 [Phellopilus nigrolimitatus]
MTSFSSTHPTHSRWEGSSSTTEMATVTSTFVTTVSGQSTTFTSVVVVPSGSLNTGGDGNHTSLSKGTVAGVVLVSVLAVSAVALWVFFAYRRRLRRNMHRSLRYAIGGGGGGGGRLSGAEHGARSGMRSLGAGLGLGGFGYALGRDRSNSSSVPIRTSPLHDEDADLESPHNLGPGPGDEMREAGAGLRVLPGWLVPTDTPDAPAERMRGGDDMQDHGGAILEGDAATERGIGLLEAAGLVDAAQLPKLVHSRRRSSLSGITHSTPGPSQSPLRNSLSIEPDSPSSGGRERSTSPLLDLHPSVLLARDGPPEASRGKQKLTLARNASGSVDVGSKPPPPSAWTSGEKGKEREKGPEADLSSPASATASDTGTFGRVRSRSSTEVSPVSHGRDGNTLPVTSSSQGHGSATASGENEVGYSSGTGSSGSHSGSKASHMRPSRKNSDGAGFLVRAASRARTNVRTRLRRASASSPPPGADDDPFRGEPPRAKSKSPERRRVSILKPVRPVPSASAPSPSPAVRFGLTLGAAPALAVKPPSPVFPATRQPSSLLRSHSPGPIAYFPPPIAPSAMMRPLGPGSALSIIQGTPSPMLTTDSLEGLSDGLLDPRLMTRLREIHSGQASASSIGLRDHEDYSRPIGGLVKNRPGSSTTVSSHYSQYSGHSTQHASDAPLEPHSQP